MYNEFKLTHAANPQLFQFAKEGFQFCPPSLSHPSKIHLCRVPRTNPITKQLCTDLYHSEILKGTISVANWNKVLGSSTLKRKKNKLNLTHQLRSRQSSKRILVLSKKEIEDRNPMILIIIRIDGFSEY